MTIVLPRRCRLCTTELLCDEHVQDARASGFDPEDPERYLALRCVIPHRVSQLHQVGVVRDAIVVVNSEARYPHDRCGWFTAEEVQRLSNLMFHTLEGTALSTETLWRWLSQMVAYDLTVDDMSAYRTSSYVSGGKVIGHGDGHVMKPVIVAMWRYARIDPTSLRNVLLGALHEEQSQPIDGMLPVLGRDSWTTAAVEGTAARNVIRRNHQLDALRRGIGPAEYLEWSSVGLYEADSIRRLRRHDPRIQPNDVSGWIVGIRSGVGGGSLSEKSVVNALRDWMDSGLDHSDLAAYCGILSSFRIGNHPWPYDGTVSWKPDLYLGVLRLLEIPAHSSDRADRVALVIPPLVRLIGVRLEVLDLRSNKTSVGIQTFINLLTALVGQFGDTMLTDLAYFCSTVDPRKHPLSIEWLSRYIRAGGTPELFLRQYEVLSGGTAFAKRPPPEPDEDEEIRIWAEALLLSLEENVPVDIALTWVNPHR